MSEVPCKPFCAGLLKLRQSSVGALKCRGGAALARIALSLGTVSEPLLGSMETTGPPRPPRIALADRGARPPLRLSPTDAAGAHHRLLRLVLAAMIAVLALMVLHAAKADLGLPLPSILVFSPLIILPAAVLFSLVNALLTLPRDERPSAAASAGATLGAMCALVGGVQLATSPALTGGDGAPDGAPYGPPVYWVLIFTPLCVWISLQVE